MKFRSTPSILAVFLCFLALGIFAPSARALEAIRDTEAYEQFCKKPQDDFAKLIFMMNYYHDAKFTIVFDGVDYAPFFVFPFAKIYLFTHYDGEETEQWVKKHCYRSLLTQDIIYVRFPSGKYEPARDLILRDLGQLEKALREDQKGGALERVSYGEVG